MAKRIIVVSNRLPLKVSKEGGEYRYTRTSGGLVTGLNCAKESLNFGWMGTLEGVEEGDRESVRSRCIEEFGFYPIFIEEGVYDRYYNNMCNGALWPVLHSFSDLVRYEIGDYVAYKEVNRIFCREVVRNLRDGDLVWVHDYHLMLLPEMIREECRADVRIGFFLHIPFPSVATVMGFGLLYPLVKGVLGSDLVGFHTFEYVGNFRNACSLFEESVSAFSIKTSGRSVQVEAIPIGIDPSLFLNESLKKATKERADVLKRKFGDKKIILGVDRVDYIKGIPHRLKAFSRVLKKRPDLAGKVVFCQVGVPSRGNVRVYRVLSDTLCRLSGSVNSVGDIEETNVHFVNSSISFTELCALYLVSDVCVISSLRDGMNLVSLEFIACAGSGALVMSDYAGATGMLVGSIQTNPWDIEDLSNSYAEALDMPETERIERKTSMQKVIGKYTATEWANRFIGELSQIKRC